MSKQQAAVPQTTQQKVGVTTVLPSLPGVRRDGTSTDSDYFSDAQWCRFIKGKPRKMGGFQEISSNFSGPIYNGFFWSRQFVNICCAFSTTGVELCTTDQNGVGSGVQAITPAAYVPTSTTLWSYDYLYDDASGADATLLLAAPINTLQNMDDPTLVPVYVTPLNNPGIMTAVTDANAVCSGGIFCTQPYTVLLGNDGNVTWSDINSPQNYTTGDAGSDRVTGTKIVVGLPLRTGNASGALLWSLDSVLRMDWVGGAAIFKFSHLSTESSILSQRCVIEVDSKWFWIGIDRFMVTNGSQVEELPNEMNLQWFFDNLNFAQRQKVFAMKMPKFGEIWWHFPKGNSTECNHAIIFNYRLKTWYDTAISRGYGYAPATYRYPVMMGNVPNKFISLLVTAPPSALFIGQYIKGINSGAQGTIMSVAGEGPYTIKVARIGNIDFGVEGFTDGTISGSITNTKPLYSVYSHERGYDANADGMIVAIPSSFSTCDFGMPTGGPEVNAKGGGDFNTRITRIEPDFNMSGGMTVQVIGKQWAQFADVVSRLYTFTPETGKIDLREQAREFRLKFESNSLGGFFECGKTLVHLEQGDIRP